tara:strand:- start:23 stop:160 length:138 start_codon:yes stop_codon:yes gene_type:complete
VFVVLGAFPLGGGEVVSVWGIGGENEAGADTVLESVGDEVPFEGR